jgi:hypothetical protein
MNTHKIGISRGQQVFIASGLVFFLLHTLLALRSTSTISICINQVPERDLSSPLLERIDSFELSYDLITGHDRDEQELIEKIDSQSILNVYDIKSGPVTIMTIAHFKLRQLVLNWIKSLQMCNLSKFVVLSHDLELVEFLIHQNYSGQVALVPRKWYTNPHNITINANSSLWIHGDEFNRIDSFKFHIMRQLVSRNRSILFSESDFVWMSADAVEYLQFKMAHCHARVAFAQNLNERKVSLNADFFYANANSNVTKRLLTVLVNEWNDSPGLSAANSVEVRQVLDSAIKPAFTNIEIFRLDPLLYASQRVFSELKPNIPMSIRPFVVQAEHSPLTHKKIEMMKLNGLWLLDDN